MYPVSFLHRVHLIFLYFSPPPPRSFAPVALSPHYRRFQQRFNTTRQSVLRKHRGAFTLSPHVPPSATLAASSSQEGTHVTASFRAHARPISARGAQRNRASPGGDEKRALIPRGGSSRSFSASSVSAASSPWPEVFCGCYAVEARNSTLAPQNSAGDSNAPFFASSETTCGEGKTSRKS